MLEIYKECRESGLLTNKTPSNEIKTIQQETEKYDNREEIMSKNSSNKFNIADFVISKLHTRYIRSLLAKPFVILTGNSLRLKETISYCCKIENYDNLYYPPYHLNKLELSICCTVLHS